MTSESLLPNNETTWEGVLSSTSAEMGGVDAAAIIRAFDPFACAAALLPWLAHALSLDFWSDDWSESKKRRVISRAIELHFLKGTEPGLRAYVALAEAIVLKVETAPRAIYSGQALSVAERERWLAQMPQIRIWRARETRIATRKLFYGGQMHHAFLNTGFAQPSTAGQRLRRRCRYIVAGQETETPVYEEPGGFQVRIRSARGRRAFGQGGARRFLLPSTAAQRIISITASGEPAPWRSPVAPSRRLVNAEPDRIVTAGARHLRVFGSDRPQRRFYQRSAAWRSIYLRYAVFDGAHVQRRSPAQFMGVGRFGFPAHVAFVTVSIPGHRPAFAAGTGVVSPKSRFWLPHNPDRVREVRDAIIASKRKSDRIMLRFAPTPAVKLGAPFIVGNDSFIIGRPLAA